MTDPKKPAPTPPAPVRRRATNEEIQRDADAARVEWEASKPLREKIAREAADAEMERIVDKAIEWKKLRGKYPWEEPLTQAQIEQAQWLKNSGIDHDKITADVRRDMEARIQAREKKTGQGR